MAKRTAAAPILFDLDERDTAVAEDDGLDLEALLNLEESADITRLLQEVRAGVADAPARPEAREEDTPRPVRRTVRVDVDLESIARALGEVQVQGRQVVVACPSCGSRPTVVIYAKRFKCFGCEAAGDEAALVALLTGWDEGRAALWLDRARDLPAEEDAPPARRPGGRRRLFAR